MKMRHCLNSIYIELIDIVNSYFNFGEKNLNSKVVRRILKFFLERFRPKLTPIKESKTWIH